MNPLILFDYCYYKIANYYKDFYVLEHQKEFAGVIFLSLLQTINIVTLFLYFFTLRFASLHIIVGYLFLLILNIIRYKKIISYSTLSERWKKGGRIQNVIKSTFVIIYLVITFTFFVIVTY
jgi:hypothetical protein